MSWQHAIVVVFIALGSLATIYAIGKERQPLTSGMATAVLTVNGALVFLILTG
jgi:hypothetical protein